MLLKDVFNLSYLFKLVFTVSLINILSRFFFYENIDGCICILWHKLFCAHMHVCFLILYFFFSLPFRKRIYVSRIDFFVQVVNLICQNNFNWSSFKPRLSVEYRLYRCGASLPLAFVINAALYCMSRILDALLRADGSDVV